MTNSPYQQKNILENWVAKENGKFSKLNAPPWLLRTALPEEALSGWPCFSLPEEVGGEFPDKSLTSLPVLKTLHSKHSTEYN